MDQKGNHTTNYHPQALKEIINVMDILELKSVDKGQNAVGSSHNWHIYYSY